MAKARLTGMGTRLKALRDKADLSQQALAMKAGLSIGAVAKLEFGKRADPKLSTVIALAKALGLPLGELAEELARGVPKEKPRRGGAA